MALSTSPSLGTLLSRLCTLQLKRLCAMCAGPACVVQVFSLMDFDGDARLRLTDLQRAQGIERVVVSSVLEVGQGRGPVWGRRGVT